MTDVANRMGTVAEFGRKYRAEKLGSQSIEFDDPPDPFNLRFFLKRAFASARSESLAGDYRERTEEVLRSHESDIRRRWSPGAGGISDDELEQALNDADAGNRYDRQMVLELLDLLEDLEDNDLNRHTKEAIKGGNVDQIYDRLIDVYFIGPKKATL